MVGQISKCNIPCARSTLVVFRFEKITHSCVAKSKDLLYHQRSKSNFVYRDTVLDPHVDFVLFSCLFCRQLILLTLLFPLSNPFPFHDFGWKSSILVFEMTFVAIAYCKMLSTILDYFQFCINALWCWNHLWCLALISNCYGLNLQVESSDNLSESLLLWSTDTPKSPLYWCRHGHAVDMPEYISNTSGYDKIIINIRHGQIWDMQGHRILVVES